jgi:hypothetical protein
VDAKEKARAKRLWDYFKITPEEWDRVLDYQGGVCFICQQKPKLGKRLSVDHMHYGSEDAPAGMVRGLLCFRCNAALGKLESSRIRWVLRHFIRLVLYVQNPPFTAVLGRQVLGYPGRTGTKKHRKQLRDEAKKVSDTPVDR